MGGNKLEKNLSTLQGRVKRRQSQVQTRGVTLPNLTIYIVNNNKETVGEFGRLDL